MSPNNRYHYIHAIEFCSGCGESKLCEAIVEATGRIDCWCKECWWDFLGLAYIERALHRRAPKDGAA